MAKSTSYEPGNGVPTNENVSDRTFSEEARILTIAGCKRDSVVLVVVDFTSA
jgi:hypothetical protein